VVQAGHGEGLLEETLFDDGAAGVFLVELFNGDNAARRIDVFSFEDGAKTAAADVFNDPVIANLSASHNPAPSI
jgi:hypothetical protein